MTPLTDDTYTYGMLTTAMPTKGFFAIRLRELRDAGSLTQAALAERAALSEAAIKQFESGRREPTYETLTKLARALGVSLLAFDQDAEPEKPRGRRKPPAKE